MVNPLFSPGVGGDLNCTMLLECFKLVASKLLDLALKHFCGSLPALHRGGLGC
jgi:hypothetical protein